MKYYSIADVALVTNDMEKTVRFYRDVLGMSVVVTFAFDINGQRLRHYFFKLGPASCLSFFEWPGVELLPRKDAGRRARRRPTIRPRYHRCGQRGDTDGPTETGT